MRASGSARSCVLGCWRARSAGERLERKCLSGPMSSLLVEGSQRPLGDSGCRLWGMWTVIRSSSPNAGPLDPGPSRAMLPCPYESRRYDRVCRPSQALCFHTPRSECSEYLPSGFERMGRPRCRMTGDKLSWDAAAPSRHTYAQPRARPRSSWRSHPGLSGRGRQETREILSPRCDEA